VTGPADPAAIEEAVALANWAEVAVVVVGDQAGHRGRGTVGEGSDADDLRLPGAQPQLLERIIATGTPTVVVVMAGRAHDLSSLPNRAAAVIQSWFPGEEGAEAVAAALVGESNPGGRTPITFSRGAGQQPLYYDNRPLSRQDYGFSPAEPVFCFGHGLSYTSFAYSDLRLRESTPTDGVITVGLTLANIGPVAGDEVVQVYVRDEVASVVRPVKQLKGFGRISLVPGEVVEVDFSIPCSSLAFAGPDFERVVEPGSMTVEVGASSEDIRLRGLVVLTGPPYRPTGRPAAYSGPIVTRS
jgi:hypothetical protein